MRTPPYFFATVCICCAQMSHAESTTDFSFKSALKGIYDSSVGISELDQNSREADIALLGSVAPKLKFKANSQLSFDAEFKASQKRYQEQSSFDVGIQRWHLSGKYKIGKSSVSYAWDNADAELDGSDYLDLNIHTIALDRLFSSQFYARLNASTKEKTFPGRMERDAKGTGIGLLILYFFNDHKDTLSFSISHDSETATLPAYNNTAVIWHVSWAHKSTLGNKPIEYKIQYNHGEIDYDSVFLDLGIERADSQKTATLDMTMALSNYADFVLEFSRKAYESNVLGADFEANIVSAGFELKF